MEHRLFRDADHPLAQALQSLIQQRLLLLLPGFLSEQDCQQLYQQLCVCPASAAESEDPEDTSQSPDWYQARKAHLLEVPARLESHLMARFNPLANLLGQHFGQYPTRRERPQFLRYLPGDYFRLHRDWGPAKIYKQRRLSLVLFLNGHEASAHGLPGFEGGDLVFLLRNSQQKNQWLPIPPAAGLLAAFDSRLLHEVTPVIKGERYSVVTWLCE